MEKGGAIMRDEVLAELGFGIRQRRKLQALMAEIPEGMRGYLLLAIVTANGEGHGCRYWKYLARQIVASSK